MKVSVWKKGNSTMYSIRSNFKISRNVECNTEVIEYNIANNN
jgi:hypothetical protein